MGEKKFLLECYKAFKSSYLSRTDALYYCAFKISHLNVFSLMGGNRRVIKMMKDIVKIMYPLIFMNYESGAGPEKGRRVYVWFVVTHSGSPRAEWEGPGK